MIDPHVCGCGWVWVWLCLCGLIRVDGQVLTLDRPPDNPKLRKEMEAMAKADRAKLNSTIETP